MTCIGPECNRAVNVKNAGLCRSHYMQQWEGKELTPIRAYKTNNVNGDQRKCKTCQEWKNEEECFYSRAGGAGKQSECKECLGRRARRNLLVREGRLDEAALLA